MARAGIRAVVEPAFWLGQPRTHVGTFDDYFQALIGWERFRASQFGITHYCTIALNPKEANSPKLADDVLELLPHYLGKDGVVAVGEIGFDDQTAAEEKYFVAQLDLARTFDLPVLIHTPHRDKKCGTERSLADHPVVGDQVQQRWLVESRPRSFADEQQPSGRAAACSPRVSLSTRGLKLSPPRSRLTTRKSWPHSRQNASGNSGRPAAPSGALRWYRVVR